MQAWLKIEERQDIAVSESQILPIEVSAVHSLNSEKRGGGGAHVRTHMHARFTFVFLQSPTHTLDLTE